MTAQDTLDIQNRHRLTVEEYCLLAQEGAFGDRRTELFEGEVYYMSPKHRPHARVLTTMLFAVRDGLADRQIPLQLLTDISIRLSDHTVLEPDIAITDSADGDGLLPLVATRLVIEIASTTLATDLGLKADLYAAAGVPEYWVVDVQERRVLMHANPRGYDSAYDGQLDVPFGETLHAATIEGLQVDTTGLH